MFTPYPHIITSNPCNFNDTSIITKYPIFYIFYTPWNFNLLSTLLTSHIFLTFIYFIAYTLIILP